MPLKTYTYKNQQGFSLLEMSLALCIAGIIMTMALSLLSMWLRYKRIETTRENFSFIQEALAEYYNHYGAYPCPGPRIDFRSAFEFENDCRLLTSARQEAARKRGVFTSSIKLQNDQKATVVEGAVPYRRLNIPLDKIYDGDRRMITYSVSDQLTSRDTFDSVGSIAIIDRASHPVVSPPRSVLFVLVAHGDDGAGAFLPSGKQLPCDVKHADGGNCDHDGTFVNDEQSRSDDRHYYDDFMFYTTWVNPAKKPFAKSCVVNQTEPSGPSLVNDDKTVDDGVLVRLCKTPSACGWFMCSDGALKPAQLKLKDLTAD